jgi:hypothetical protein
MIIRRLLGATVVAVLLLTSQASFAAASPAPHPGLTKLRAATTKFHNLDTAKAKGYGLLTDEAGVTCIAQRGMGAMGVHYVNGDLVANPAIVASTPEAMVYRRDANGVLRLSAVEYVVIKAAWDANHKARPKLFGHKFNFSKAPNRFDLPAYYSLHVWVFKHNPAGMFEMWNPNVHCPFF